MSQSLLKTALLTALLSELELRKWSLFSNCTGQRDLWGESISCKDGCICNGEDLLATSHNWGHSFEITRDDVGELLSTVWDEEEIANHLGDIMATFRKIVPELRMLKRFATFVNRRI